MYGKKKVPLKRYALFRSEAANKLLPFRKVSGSTYQKVFCCSLQIIENEEFNSKFTDVTLVFKEIEQIEAHRVESWRSSPSV